MKTYILALMLVLTAVLCIALFYGFRHLSVLRNQVNQNTNLIVGLQSMLSTRVDTLVQPQFYQMGTIEEVNDNVEEVNYEELSDVEDSDNEDSDNEEDQEDSDNEEDHEDLGENHSEDIEEHFENFEEETTPLVELDNNEDVMDDMVQKLVSKTEEVVKTRKRNRPSESVTNFEVGDNLTENGVNYMVTLTPSGRKKWTMSV